MIKRLVPFMIVFLLTAVAAFAEPETINSKLPQSVPATAGESLSEIFDMGPVAALVAGTANAELKAQKPYEPNRSTCSAEADCDDGSTVSCTGNSQCSAVDSNCSSAVRGHVTCDGITTQCPSCPPQCTFFECRQPCRQPGCVAVCLSLVTCECDTICM